jgi:hypothetical protein
MGRELMGANEMKLVIKFGYNKNLAIAIDDMGIVLRAFSEGVSVESKGYGAETKYTVKEKTPFEFSLVDDAMFEVTPEPIVAVQERAKTAEGRYYKEYTARVAAEKERDEIKETLAKLKATVAGEEGGEKGEDGK